MRPTVFLMGSRHKPAQNPEKVPFVMQMPFELKNSITGKGSRLKERGCLYEISLVFACLQQNNFEEKHCAKEVTTFHECFQTYLTNQHTAKDQARKGILTPNTKNLKFSQVNQLLRKYPQI